MIVISDKHFCGQISIYASGTNDRTRIHIMLMDCMDTAHETFTKEEALQIIEKMNLAIEDFDKRKLETGF